MAPVKRVVCRHGRDPAGEINEPWVTVIGMGLPRCFHPAHVRWVRTIALVVRQIPVQAETYLRSATDETPAGLYTREFARAWRLR